MRCDQTFCQNLSLLLLLPPRRQRSSINSHLAKPTSANSISSNPPSVSLPSGEATKCTRRKWEWPAGDHSSFSKTHNLPMIYVHTRRQMAEWCVQLWGRVRAHSHIRILTAHPRKICKTWIFLQCLKWYLPGREGKTGLVSPTSRKCSSLLAAQGEMLEPNQRIYRMC